MLLPGRSAEGGLWSRKGVTSLQPMIAMIIWPVTKGCNGYKGYKGCEGQPMAFCPDGSVTSQGQGTVGARQA
eukprot:1140360-Pelagomonas_calceolata.AAC.3